MADVVPLNFPLPGENILSNYNYQDIANGAGYAKFYATSNRDSAGSTVYSLITSPEEAQEPSTFTGRDTDTTYNFDIQFNTQRVINGNCFATIPFYNYVYSSNNSTTTCYVSLYKYDGSTETQIGSTINLAYTPPATGTTAYFEMLCAKINPSSIVNFKKGDFLRLKVRVVNSNSANGNTGGGISIDPTNSTFSGSEDGDCRTKVLSILIPFKINN